MVAEQFEWRDVEPLARGIFNVWTSQGDLAWAQTAWAILGEQGLTSRFDDEVGDLRTLSRMIALGLFYHTFSRYAFEQSASDPHEWMDGHPLLTDVEPLRQLSPELFDGYRELFDGFPNDNDRESRSARREFLANAWRELLEVEYTLVVAALREGFGHETELFVSLWCTRRGSYAGWRTFPEEVRYEVLNEDVLIGGKPAAYQWLSGGASYLADW